VVVGMLTEGADPVRKISIIPRGLAYAAAGVEHVADEGTRGDAKIAAARAATE
jgi:ATP-dependent Zn protease